MDRDRVTRCRGAPTARSARGVRGEGTPARRGGRRRRGSGAGAGADGVGEPVAPGSAQDDRREVGLGRRRDQLVAGVQQVGGVGRAPGEGAPLEHLVELGGGAGGEQRGAERQQGQEPTTPHRGSLPARLRTRTLRRAPVPGAGRRGARWPGSALPPTTRWADWRGAVRPPSGTRQPPDAVISAACSTT